MKHHELFSDATTIASIVEFDVPDVSFLDSHGCLRRAQLELSTKNRIPGSVWGGWDGGEAGRIASEMGWKGNDSF